MVNKKKNEMPDERVCNNIIIYNNINGVKDQLSQQSVCLRLTKIND